MAQPAKVGIVTGAGGRIGRGIAAMLVGEGYRLIVNDLEPVACERVAGELAGRGATVMTVPGDVSVRADADAVVEMAFGLGAAWICWSTAPASSPTPPLWTWRMRIGTASSA